MEDSAKEEYRTSALRGGLAYERRCGTAPDLGRIKGGGGSSWKSNEKEANRGREMVDEV